jgi:hypothetical protein
MNLDYRLNLIEQGATTLSVAVSKELCFKWYPSETKSQDYPWEILQSLLWTIFDFRNAHPEITDKPLYEFDISNTPVSLEDTLTQYKL